MICEGSGDACDRCGRKWPVGVVGKFRRVCRGPEGEAARAKHETMIRARLAVCFACEHCLDEERCGVLVAGGLPGYLMNARGVPRPASCCPRGKWGSAD